MNITEQFLSSIINNFELNKAQFELLGLCYPAEENWYSAIVNSEIDQRTFELLVLLRGNIALKTQKQIINNYDLLNRMNNSDNEIKEINKKVDKDFAKLVIYCDGACKNNPGEAGSGIAVYNDNQKPVLYYGNYIMNGTNNIAELNALNKALQIASDSNAKDIVIYSDSKYSIDCITTWSYGWKSKGWKKKGGEIKNLELIKEMHNLYNNIKDTIEIKHVKAHAGIEGNELADRMAVHTIKAKNIEYKIHNYDELKNVLSMTSY